MVEWAERAGRLVNQELPELHEDNFVTCVNLSLFWHSQGSWRIAHLYKGEGKTITELTLILCRKCLQLADNPGGWIQGRPEGDFLEVGASSASLLGRLPDALPQFFAIVKFSID